MEPINSSDTNLEAPRSHRGAEKIRADDPRVNAITQRIIGVAIEVHQVLGPGLLEPTYQKAMGIEFTDAGIKYEEQLRIPAYYKGRKLGEYCIDSSSRISSLSKSRASNE